MQQQQLELELLCMLCCSNTAMKKVIVDERDLILAR